MFTINFPFLFYFVFETINVEFFESIDQNEYLLSRRCLVKAIVHKITKKTLKIINVTLEIIEIVVEFSLKYYVYLCRNITEATLERNLLCDGRECRTVFA